MRVQTMATQSNGQQSLIDPYSLTLNEVGNQLGNSGKPLGGMNLDELLKSVWSTEENQSAGMDIDSSTSASSLQRQASLTLARALSGKTVDQVWKEIQQGQKKRYGGKMRGQEQEPILGEITLEDFLVQAGLFAEATLSSSMELAVDAVTPESFPRKMVLPSSPSTGTLSDTTTSGRKRDATNELERAIDRRLRRKIKNRESAARSRARKQTYHNELVSKVSRLEEENLKLKKEKEFENKFPLESPCEQKYQLRRTSSSSF